jgi:lipoyl synthase
MNIKHTSKKLQNINNMQPDKKHKPTTPKPSWLKRRLPSGPVYEQVRALLKKGHLHTVCQEARCPNVWECFSQKTATFLILGDRCTRNCGFCAVAHGPAIPLDTEEPLRVAKAVEQMALQYVVITSVTRDDLPDGGAGVFAETIENIRNRMPETYIEVLIPDFKGNIDAIKKVVFARPHVFNHNIETVPGLYSKVRPQADYHRSLYVLEMAKKFDPLIITKSGIMLGLGEEEQEVFNTFQDLLNVGCNILTIGQYLQPTQDHLPVKRFVPPEEFQKLREKALKMGFDEVASGPFVRSSYHAKDLFEAI